MNTGRMTKAELVEEVSRVSDLTKKHSEVIVDTVFKSIIDALHRGEKIELRGFGSFRLRRRARVRPHRPCRRLQPRGSRLPRHRPGRDGGIPQGPLDPYPAPPGECRDPDDKAPPSESSRPMIWAPAFAGVSGKMAL